LLFYAFSCLFCLEISILVGAVWVKTMSFPPPWPWIYAVSFSFFWFPPNTCCCNSLPSFYWHIFVRSVWFTTARLFPARHIRWPDLIEILGETASHTEAASFEILVYWPQMLFSLLTLWFRVAKQSHPYMGFTTSKEQSLDDGLYSTAIFYLSLVSGVTGLLEFFSRNLSQCDYRGTAMTKCSTYRCHTLSPCSSSVGWENMKISCGPKSFLNTFLPAWFKPYILPEIFYLIVFNQIYSSIVNAANQLSTRLGASERFAVKIKNKYWV
jgi:hypothetical protein